MPKSFKFSEENKNEITTAMKNTVDKKCYRRLEIVNLRIMGKKCSEIAEITGYNSNYISQILSKYFKYGILSIAEDKRTGNNRKLTYEEEQELLKPFKKEAESGKMLIVSDIRKAYEEKTGEVSSVPTVYLLLKRHGWRKIMPRSRHPQKASDEAIEAYKKNQC